MKFVGSQDVPAFICVGAQAKDKAALIYIYIYAARDPNDVFSRGSSSLKIRSDERPIAFKTPQGPFRTAAPF